MQSVTGRVAAGLTFPVEGMTCAACASRVQRQLSKVAQHEELPGACRHLREHAHHRPDEHRNLLSALQRVEVQLHLDPDLLGEQMPLAPRRQGPALVLHDGEQPGRETGTPLVAVEAPGDSQQHFLGGVLRVVAVAHDGEAAAENPWAVAREDRLQAACVARPVPTHTGDELLVRRLSMAM